MRYSIIMPCLFRKREHKETVLNCIGSVQQHSKDYELIIVDDGSPLGTAFLRQHADIYIRHKKPLGIATSWNDGLLISNGSLLVVINDDITARAGWLQAMENALAMFPMSAVSSCAIEHMPVQAEPEESRHWFPGSCFMMPRKTLAEIGYFDEQFSPYNYEDVDYWTRVYRKGRTLSRDYSVQVGHKEGQVIHTFKDQDEVTKKNLERYIKKWGFDPKHIFYGGYGQENFPWE